jgi:hypothetical protein
VPTVAETIGIAMVAAALSWLSKEPYGGGFLIDLAVVPGSAMF